MSLFKGKKDKASVGGENSVIDMDKNAKNKVKKKRVITILVILALIIAAVLLVPRFMRNQAMAKAQSEVQYKDVAVEVRDLTVTLSGSGTITPANSYTVTSLVEGEILSADFEEGDIVSEDTVLYTIDSSDASATLEKAQMSFEQSQRSYQNTLESIEDLNVKAENTGIITEWLVEEGD
ncbi:MAG: RND transporter, partial [Clostridia bacterium]|nr:RND transporter [Clostridia bacterium]